MIYLDKVCILKKLYSRIKKCNRMIHTNAIIFFNNKIYVV